MPVERHWTPCPMWRGETAFILGGGPSLPSYDLSLLVGRCVVAINNAWYARPGAEYWRDDVPVEPGPWPIAFFNDPPWWDQYGEEFAAFPGLKVSPYRKRNLPGVAHLRVGLHRQVDDRDGWIGYGNDGGINTILLLEKLGVARVGLLAFDHRVIDGRHNWHGRHVRPITDDAYDFLYRPAYEDVAPALQARMQIWNCTPGSALTVFPSCDYRDLL